MIKTVFITLLLIIVSPFHIQSQSKENLKEIIEKLNSLSTYKCQLNYTIGSPYGGSRFGQSTLTYSKATKDTLCGMNYLVITNPDYRKDFADFTSYFDGCIYVSFNGKSNKICINENPNAFVSTSKKSAMHKSLPFRKSLPNGLAELLMGCLNDTINYRYFQKPDTLIRNEICSYWEIINYSPEMSYIDRIITHVAFSQKTHLPKYFKKTESNNHSKTNISRITEYLFAESNPILVDDFFSEETINKQSLISKNDNKVSSTNSLVGQLAPNFNLPIIDSNKKLSLNSLLGKYVLVEFTATWCGPCLPAAKMLEELEGKYHDNSNVKIFSIYSDSVDNEKVINKYRNKHGLKNTMLYKGEKVKELYEVNGYPQFLIISTDGKIIQRYIGYNNETKQNILTLLDALVR